MKSSQIATALTAVSALALFAAPSFAQIYEPKQPVYADSDDIIVTAPGVQHYDTGRRTSSGAPIVTLTEQRVVETADLDLRYNADVRVLRRRIDATVADACRDVERETITPLDTNRDCVRTAMNDAMAQADDMIATARG